MFLTISSAEQVARRLLEETACGLCVPFGPAASMVVDGELTPTYTVGAWRGEAWMAVPLEWRALRHDRVGAVRRRTLHPSGVRSVGAGGIPGGRRGSDMAHTFHPSGAGTKAASKPHGMMINDPGR